MNLEKLESLIIKALEEIAALKVTVETLPTKDHLDQLIKSSLSDHRVNCSAHKSIGVVKKGVWALILTALSGAAAFFIKCS